jgi:TadE-like protein
MIDPEENEKVRTVELEALPRGRRSSEALERKRCRRTAGQTTVEFLLVCLPLLALIFLAIQLCLIWSAESMVQVAAYSAARKFAVCGNETSALQAAMLYLPFAKSEDVTLSIGTSPGYGVLGGPTDPPGQLKLGQTFYVQLSVVYHILPFPIVEQFFFDSFPQMTVEGPYGPVGPQENAPNSETLGVNPPDTVTITNRTTVQPPYTHSKVDLYYNEYKDLMGNRPTNNFTDLGEGWTNETDIVNVARAVGWAGWPVVTSNNDSDNRYNEIYWLTEPGRAAWYFDQLTVKILEQEQVPGTYDFYYTINHWSVESKMDGRITMYAGSVMTYESNGD